MTDVFKLLVDFFKDIINMLNSVTFEFFDLQLTLGTTLASFLIVGFVISIFWKGART